MGHCEFCSSTNSFNELGASPESHLLISSTYQHWSRPRSNPASAFSPQVFLALTVVNAVDSGASGAL